MGEGDQVIQERRSGGAVVSRYLKGRFLGKGGFARCYEVSEMDSVQHWAMKIVMKDTLKKAKAKQKLVTEIKIHKSLSHKHIITFDHVFEDTTNVYIVLELCPNHTLNELMKRRRHLTEQEVQCFMLQIIDGLMYLHHNKVIHRDLKLGNLMLGTNMEIKIGDFGLAAKLQTNTERRKTICGTPNYLAPEIINNTGHSYEVDVWSLGVVMYTLLYGRPPFETSEIKKTYSRITEGQYTFNEEVHVSLPAKNLISRILVVDATKRLTLQGILAHPFLSTVKMNKQVQLHHSQYKDVVFSERMLSKGPSVRTSSGIARRLLRNGGGSTNSNVNGNVHTHTTTNTINSANHTHTTHMTTPQHAAAYTDTVPLANNFFSKGDVGAATYVRKWVDYSSKYGLGYLLSDGSTGIYFNDATKMVINPSQNVDYVAGKDYKCFSATEPDLSKEMSKKLTLLQYFRKYLATTAEGSKQNAPFTYLKRFVKSEEAIVFRLSNRIVQCNFNDKSQIVLHCDQLKIMYTCGKEKIVMEMGTVDVRVEKKIQHMKGLLRKIMREEEEIGG